MDPQTLMVFVTCPPRQARALARRLVHDRLAACANILPAGASVYRWQGTLHHARESLLLIKTTARRFPALKRAVLNLHPYELPEVVAVKMAHGHRPYLNWITEQCA